MERPFVFQKFTFHGLVLARELLSKARDEANQYCMADLAKEISKRQEKIDEFTKVNDKKLKIDYKVRQG